MKTTRKLLLMSAILALVAAIGVAQGFRGRGRRGRDPHAGNHIIYTEGREAVDEATVRTAREIASHSSGTPNWTNAPGFGKDVFTFARVLRSEDPNCSWSAGNWITDYPDSDLNLSYRIQQMTSMKVDPDGRVIRLTEPELFDYPWIYMVEVGSLLLQDEEVPILRRYLLNGGVLMADDFWGERHWQQFAGQIKRALPEREFVELPMDHPLFHAVFPLEGPKSSLQTPNIRIAIRTHGAVTWEYHDGEECREMHVRAILDDKGRIMVIATHNCDNGDGWEREGEDDFFFHEFSEKRAFPLGINIIFYVMTH